MTTKIITVNDHVRDIISETSKAVNSFTYPVFIKASNEKPELIASSLAIQYKGQYYLVTASHVIDDINKYNSDFYIGINDKFVKIDSKFTRTLNKNNNLDIAFARIPDDFISCNRISYVKEELILHKRNFKKFNLAFIHGYPCSKNKQIPALKGSFEFRSFAFTCGGKIERSFKRWTEFKKDIGSHIPMKYGKAKDINGRIITPPNPAGLSGGGLWIIPDYFKPKFTYLTGIVIAYLPREKIIFSTKLEE